MQISQILLSVGVGGVLLFLWTGFTQNVLPWGVKSVRQHHEQDALGSTLADVLPSGMLYVKHRVAAFIAIRPEQYYAMPRYFAIEFATQLAVAAVLTALLTLTSTLPDIQRFGVIALAAAAGILGIDVQYWNWWGFSTRYTLGVALNRLMGYLLVTFVLITWIL